MSDPVFSTAIVGLACMLLWLLLLWTMSIVHRLATAVLSIQNQIELSRLEYREEIDELRDEIEANTHLVDQ